MRAVQSALFYAFFGYSMAKENLLVDLIFIIQIPFQKILSIVKA
ncbi:hypothetical protein [Flavobacterium sp. N3904]|nr:hypothetical protein [Flavobacterium sp. N3904]